jgi:GDP-L-fucose synthase
VALDRKSKIFVAGNGGLVGSAVVRALRVQGYENLLLATRGELDLTVQRSVSEFFQRERPQAVVMAAARVGGIIANNTQPAVFIRDNLLIQDNVIDSAYRAGTEKFVFLGSSCIYPKLASQPIKEEYLLTGPLEPTNEWYAIAKIAGLKMCQAYRRQYGFKTISLMPTNLYGPGDNFDLQNSHVLPALIRRFHEAKLRGDSTISIWGTGTPRREFLHVDDLADAVIFLMMGYDNEQIINIGWGEDVTIKELAEKIAETSGFQGRLVFDSTKPDGPPQKLLDTSRLKALGWKPKITLQTGIQQTYEWFKRHVSEARLTV